MKEKKEREVQLILRRADNSSSPTMTSPSSASSEPRHKFSLHPCKFLRLYVKFFVERREKYDEAVQLLNKALEEEKKEAGLYVNRGGLCLYFVPRFSILLLDFRLFLSSQ